MLSHERLDVYRVALEFVALAIAICSDAPKGTGFMVDQLRRSASSVSLNIAEGVGRTGTGDSSRHYAIARGSAMECAAALDNLVIMKVITWERHRTGKALVQRIVAMLTKMCR
jgi:four helix bundle protein